ncbi:hypothetical protein [Brevundimonas sp. NIBR11]|uniref:hypothetical protein n=1 Tax=Brevundimonas sp. NIBR11 TaxID=3015999 RepID=UPI0022F0DFD0|nr:hypothetical protein [Brevundimonas sp. NIBR11]WGM30980.1 hypothetical protein KKHFBJBL_01214 [Brevundimonas sp. NIBR11]
MGATYSPGPSSRTRAGLIALIAIRQGKAMRERRAKEEEKREAKKAAEAEAKPKKRGWFR